MTPGSRRRPRWRRPLLSLLARVLPPLLAVLLRLLQATLRIEYRNAAALRGRWSAGGQVILAFWHNRLLMLPVVAAGVPTCILVSQHRDGEFASRLLGAWGVSTVPGSATRGAVGGFLRLVDAYRHGQNLAVVPDGPRGPRYAAKPGVVHLARALDAPIFPVAYAASRAVRLKSWDRLLIPLPFARVVIEFGGPIWVAPAASASELGDARRGLEERLNALTESTGAHFGGAPPRGERVAPAADRARPPS